MQHDGTAMPAGQATVTLPRPASPFGYTAAEVAEVTGKSRDTIYVWLKDGVLNSRRIKRTHYIPVDTFRAFLNGEDAQGGEGS